MVEGSENIPKNPDFSSLPWIATVKIPKEDESIDRKILLDIVAPDETDIPKSLEEIVGKKENGEKNEDYVKRIFTTDVSINKLVKYLSECAQHEHKSIVFGNEYLKIDINFSAKEKKVVEEKVIIKDYKK